MSGWIRIDKTLTDSIRFRRVVRLVTERNLLRDVTGTRYEFVTTVVLGALVRLWIYADTHIADNDTLTIKLDEVDELVGIEGFAECLPADWLQVLDPEHVQLPNFMEHNGSSEKLRRDNARRQAEYRHRHTKHNVTPLVTSRNGSNDARPDQTIPEKTRPEGEGEGSAEGGGARAARSLATRLPEDFSLTEERKQLAEAEGLDPSRTFAQFSDYWRASAGQKSRKHDWDATWRNWCRREADDRKPAGTSRKTRYEEIMDKLHAS